MSWDVLRHAHTYMCFFLLSVMFVDIDENVSILDRIKLTYVYDEVNDNADDAITASVCFRILYLWKHDLVSLHVKLSYSLVFRSLFS